MGKSPNPAGRRGLWSVPKGKTAARMLAAGVRQHVVAAEIGVSPATLRSWFTTKPQLREMIDEHKAGKAALIEQATTEKALAMLEGEIEAGKVKGADAALKHFRWLLGKLNPQLYGEPRQQAMAGIAIQINTNALGAPEDLETRQIRFEVPIQDAQFEVADNG